MPARQSPGSVLYEPHRVAIALALADAPGFSLGFGDLMRRLRYSEGNLACHLRRLADTGSIEVHNLGGRGRASRSIFRLTALGRERLTAAGAEFAAFASAVQLALAQREPGAPAVEAGGDAGAGDGTRGEPDDDASRAVDAVLSFVDERFSGPD